MNPVTEKKQRRRSILTKDVMAGIPALVQQGLNAEAIAARLGCSAGSLKVRCSQAQISLRVPKEVKVVPLVPLMPAPEPPKPPKQKRSYAYAYAYAIYAYAYAPADFSVVVKRRGKPQSLGDGRFTVRVRLCR